MSERKKKGFSNPDLLLIHDNIKNLLVKVKSKLSDVKSSVNDLLLAELYQVSGLAESFTEQRPRSNKTWLVLADSLDREGVSLWNFSGSMRQDLHDNGRAVSAALKFAGYRLIEAGLEPKPGVETIVHMLQLASKAGNALSEVGKKDAAASVLISAAKFEELLRSADDPQGLHAQAAARATVVYYSSRMEAAWREGNDGVAQFMLQKITENEQRFALLQTRDREYIAAKLLEIGKSMLRGSPRNAGSGDSKAAQESLGWMQKAFAMIEHLEDAESPGLAELKRSILRTLARAYFLSSSQDPENLTRAEASLHELITSIDSTADHASSEYQQLRWMRLAVLKRRKAGDSVLLDALNSIVDHMSFTETNVTDILQELRTLNQQHALVTAVYMRCLQRALELDEEPELPSVDRLLLSLIYHCSKDEHVRAMKDLAAAFSDLHKAEIELPKVSSMACLTLLWQFGDRHYNAKRWSEAAEWFLAGAHQIFRSIGHSTEAKCYRKAALSHIQQREYAKAYAIIRRCPPEESATHYVILLTAVYQGLEDEAVRAVRDMVKASDFDRKMLLLATQLAHETELKSLLLAVLEALLETLRNEESIEVEIEAITVIRCIVRLVLKLLSEAGANQKILIDVLIRHLRSTKSLFEVACSKKGATIISKDISWLWRTAYNCAIQGCSEWEHAEEQVSDLFDISRELLEAYCQVALVDVDTDIYLHIINASFAAVAGRVFAIRQTIIVERPINQDDRLRTIAQVIKSCKTRIQDILLKGVIHKEDDCLRVRSFLHVLRVFEAELLCQLKEWKQLLDITGEIVKSDALAVNTFEAIADILWVEKDCPVDVLFTCLEAILHASLDHNSLSVEKFSRWLRAICSILLSRNTPIDRAKAVGYVEQAATVLEEHGLDRTDDHEAYPLDERQWLLGTAYNTGIECLHASLLDEAKRWFESSTVICRFVPDGRSRAEKISETYAHLLARYAPAS